MNLTNNTIQHRNSLKFFKLKDGTVPNDAQSMYWLYDNYLKSSTEVQRRCERNRQVLNVAKIVYEKVKQGECINTIALELQNHIQGDY